MIDSGRDSSFLRFFRSAALRRSGAGNRSVVVACSRGGKASALALTMLVGGVAGCGDGGGGMFAPLGEPLPSATPEQLETFERGREVALRRFSPETGLGPDFNVVSCVNCHEKPVLGGGSGRYRDFLLVRQVLGDGSAFDSGVNGVQPQFTLDEGGRRRTDPGTNLESNRNTIPFFGVGLLAGISEESILANVDEFDADGDGISGRANYDRGFVGRFGRKAQTVSIEGFIRGPLFNHLGITTAPLSEAAKAALPVPSSITGGTVARRDGIRRAILAWIDDLVPSAIAQVAAPEEPNFDNDDAPDPEMSEQDLFDLVSFAMLLAPPPPDPVTPVVLQGRAMFEQIGCAGCHVPSLEGPDGPVPAYSDLLLHDMGDELDDGLVMGLAEGYEFRTQPLWGIGAVGPYLHDGRADTLDEAIRWHGGEARAASEAYVALPAHMQASVIAFLDSLGGSGQRTDGLVPPGEPIPRAGEFGGPTRPLSRRETELFLRGREIFDRDMHLSEGLGPKFNGDSCRACHFDPVIGGAGPADVNVVHHGTFDGDAFILPAGGSIAHRFSIDGTRPAIDPDANVFETRQPPSLFGLGFLESIPEEAVLANENCDETEPGVVSGCAHILPGGRLGRLGWKAQVPDLDEFSRDAMTAELGMTVPEAGPHAFGASVDSDDSADPEISNEDLDTLTFFMRQLAPPPGRSTDPRAEATGRDVFDRIGCASCHVDDFVTDEGVVAYTDLLLHDVAGDGELGIVDGEALMREFRTPPLWGLSVTGPYMHDGRAFTVKDAIERHAGEAASSRDAYWDLSDGERDDLLAFLRSL